MAGSNDNRHSAVHVLQEERGKLLAFEVEQGELLGVIGKDADAVHARVYQEVDSASLTYKVQCAILVKGGGSDREYSGIHADSPHYTRRSYRRPYLQWYRGKGLHCLLCGAPIL